MPKTKRVLCKLFAHGACFKGENCEFSHDCKDPPNNICTYYQKGICSYGSQCRYEHVKASQSDLSASSSSTKPRQFGISGSVPQGPSTSTFHGSAVLSATSAEFRGSNGGFLPPTNNAWNLEPEHRDILDDGDVLEPRSRNLADRSICSFAAAGNCPRGETCPHIHGDLCPTCGKHSLHPFRPEEREEQGIKLWTENVIAVVILW